MSRIEDLLDGGYDELVAGRPIDEIAVGLNGMAAELTDLLTIGDQVRSFRMIAPRPEWKADLRQRLVTQRPLVVMANARPPRRLPRPLRVVGVAAAVIALLAGTALGADRASAGSLPGEPFYPIKRSIEDLRYTLAPAPELKASIALDLADRRLAEITSLVDRGQALPVSLSADYAAAVDRVIEDLTQSPDKVVAQRAEERFSQHETVIGAIGAAPTLSSALEASRMGRQRAAEVADRLPSQPGPLGSPPERPANSPGAPAAVPTAIRPLAPPAFPAAGPSSIPASADRPADPAAQPAVRPPTGPTDDPNDKPVARPAVHPPQGNQPNPPAANPPRPAANPPSDDPPPDDEPKAPVRPTVNPGTSNRPSAPRVPDDDDPPAKPPVRPSEPPASGPGVARTPEAKPPDGRQPERDGDAPRTDPRPFFPIPNVPALPGAGAPTHPADNGPGRTTQPDDRRDGDRPPENKPPENKPPENKPPENKPPENKPPENKPPENKPPENKPPDRRGDERPPQPPNGGGRR